MLLVPALSLGELNGVQALLRSAVLGGAAHAELHPPP